MERRPDLAPHPASADDLDGFEVIWAGRPGPAPDDVQRDLRSMSEDLSGALGKAEGMIGSRYGRRVVVAPVGSPDEVVDVVDVDISRSIVLTMGGRDPTPAGALLAQVLSVRQDVVLGFASAPEIDGPTMDVLQRLLPSLRGATATQMEGIGRIALGRSPHEVRGALESLKAGDEEDVNEA